MALHRSLIPLERESGFDCVIVSFERLSEAAHFCNSSLFGLLKQGFHGLAQIREKMPAVGDLLRIWGSLPDTVCIWACAVAADNLHPWVFSQPPGESFRLPVWQEIYRQPFFQID